MAYIVFDSIELAYDALKDYAKGLVYPWDTQLIDRAFEIAALGHSHQLRQSGEPFIYHPLAVARIVAGLRCDRNTFIAAILHDVVEDTDIDLNQIRGEFGQDVAFIVDSVTKFPGPIDDSTSSSSRLRSDTLRKTVVGISRDLRIAYIKLADRLHNLMTLGGKSPDRRARTINETVNYFGPFARELGITTLYNQLMYQALRNSIPGELARTIELTEEKRKEIGYISRKVVQGLEERLRPLDIDFIPMQTSLNSMLVSWFEFSIDEPAPYMRLLELERSMIQLTLLFTTSANRYSAMEGIHSLGPVVNSRFGDWVESPLPNGFRGVRTLINEPLGLGQLVEFTLQTSHEYKLSQLGPLFDLCRSEDYQEAYHKTPYAMTLGKIIEFDRVSRDSKQLLDYVRLEALRPKLRIFTLSGEHIHIPTGSTVLDLAYVRFPERGHQCAGAYIDGSAKEIDHILRDGDIVKLNLNAEIERPDPAWSFGKQFNMPSTRYVIEKTI